MAKKLQLNSKIPKKLSDLENDLFYSKKKIPFLTLTKDDFEAVEDPDGGTVGYLYILPYKLDWLTSVDSIEWTASVTEEGYEDTVSSNYDHDTDIFSNVVTDDGEAGVEYYSTFFPIAILSGVDCIAYISSMFFDEVTTVLSKDESCILIVYDGFENLTLDIYQIYEKKIPHDCLDAAVGYTYMTGDEEVYNSGEITVTGTYYDSSQFYCNIPSLPDFINGDLYRINISDRTIELMPSDFYCFNWTDDTGVTWGIFNSNTSYFYGPNSGDTAIPFTTTVTIIHLSKEEAVPIEERFIPDTIARKTELTTDDHINELIDAKLGVIEDGSY